MAIDSPDATWLQNIGDGTFGYSRAIAVASVEMIDRVREASGGPVLPARDHDGISHAFVDKGSTVLFCHDGKWLELPDADQD